MNDPSTIDRAVIVSACAYAAREPRSAVTGNRRADGLVAARFAAYYLMREMRPDLSLSQIGQSIGGRDHSTVLHGYKRALNWLATNPKFAALVEDAKQTALCWHAGAPLPAPQEPEASTPPEPIEPPPAPLVARAIDREDDPVDVVQMRRQGLVATSQMASLLEASGSW